MSFILLFLAIFLAVLNEMMIKFMVTVTRNLLMQGIFIYTRPFVAGIFQ